MMAWKGAERGSSFRAFFHAWHLASALLKTPAWPGKAVGDGADCICRLPGRLCGRGICGIGGGIIIKPVLDAMGIMSVSAISFLSGMTVMTMAAVTVFRQGKSGLVEFRTGFPLAAGAAAGGITGNWLFQLLKAAAGQDALVGMIQAAVLALVTLLTLLYHLVLRRRFRTYHVKNPAACGLIGGLIGVLSAFLGIGGGQINLVALYAAFSMDTKKAAANSLYIILFSQAASFSLSCLRGTIPRFPACICL